MAADVALTIGGVRHPDYLFDQADWTFWRDTFSGGENYLNKYLVRQSDRETVQEFKERKELSPITTFAKSALLDVRNNIYQRLGDVSRVGGTPAYQRAMNGENGGVNRKGADMNTFMGVDVLTELLVMGRCGVYVDSPADVPITQATPVGTPYVYVYPVEDILSWVEEDPDKVGQFKAVLLRDHCIDYNKDFGGIKLPSGPRKKRLRLVWKDEDGYVWYRLYDSDEKPMLTPYSDATGAVRTELTTIPFTMPCIGDSLLKDVASFQKTILNMMSRAIAYDMRSNSPFLTIQAEQQTVGKHLKKAGANATPGSQSPSDPEEKIGAGAGRYYDKGMNKPEFVAPPTDPLKASLQYQEILKEDIRNLINIAVANKQGSRTESAEAKKLSNTGLEAGLSFIGTVLKQCEQLIATFWASYENFKSPQVAQIAYPTRYVLKTDLERIDEANKLLEVIDQLPSETARKECAKQIITILYAGKVQSSVLKKMQDEVDSGDYTSANLERIRLALDNHLASKETLSKSMGYKDGEVEKAKKDQEHDAMITVLAQTKAAGAAPGQPALAGALPNPGARGVPGVENDGSASAEQAAGREAANE